nr:putative ribonuclease H-like domain-containing protein [Tanacetum cinerariifolium]
MNTLVRSNLVKGLPSKRFKNDHSCVACLKGKQNKASFKSKSDSGGEFRNKEMDEFCSRKETSSTNISSIKEDVHQVVKEKESPLRFISLPNRFHEAQMETSNETSNKDDGIPDNNASQKEQKEVNRDKEVPESSGNSNPTTSTKVSTNDSFELALSLTEETEVATVSTHVPTDSLFVPPVTLSVPRIISRGGSSFPEPLSFSNAMSFENRLEDFFGDTSDVVSLNDVEADLSNMETAIQFSPTLLSEFIKIIQRFKIQNVWVLVDCPSEVRPIGTKRVLKKKKDKRGIVIRNKARLVSQGHTQEEGIDYEEVFAPVARIETISLFLAYASYMGFTVYQMDVKSAILYGTIDEEVYLMQPSGFQDLEFPHRVYKVEKAMYGLHQAPRAWYGTLSKFVQVYVDDIIFGSSNPKMCREFEALMHYKFQMSAMGKLNFFLRLQVLQKKDAIFLSQDKYVGDILKKFGYTDIRAAKTPMDRKNP